MRYRPTLLLSKSLPGCWRHRKGGSEEMPKPSLPEWLPAQICQKGPGMNGASGLANSLFSLYRGSGLANPFLFSLVFKKYFKMGSIYGGSKGEGQCVCVCVWVHAMVHMWNGVDNSV